MNKEPRAPTAIWVEHVDVTVLRFPFAARSGSVAKQAARKQQLRTWKQQQQREQEEKRRQEEEERRKREDEIRRIRDLSNQDEQYNRFMKLVGGKARPRGKVRVARLGVRAASSGGSAAPLVVVSAIHILSYKLASELGHALKKSSILN